MQKLARSSRLAKWRRGVARSAVILALGAGAVVIGAFPGILHAVVPEPDPVPRRWELELKPGPLRLMTIDAQDGAGPKSYFYFTYKVTNTTSEDVLFAPIFEMASSEGDMARSGQGVSGEVTREVLKALDNPLLQDQISILGTLAVGEANAREGVVIWPASGAMMDNLTIYAAGFSGETRTLDVIDPQTKAIKHVLLRKTRVMKFTLPGEIGAQGSRPFDLSDDRWVLR